MLPDRLSYICSKKAAAEEKWKQVVEVLEGFSIQNWNETLEDFNEFWGLSNYSNAYAVQRCLEVLEQVVTELIPDLKTAATVTASLHEDLQVNFERLLKIARETRGC